MSRETKKTQISPKTKKEVTIRDKGRCIVCGAPGIGNAHFIRRSQGGLGIKENIITLCPKCHHDFDNGFKRREIEKIAREYLDNLYPNFSDYNRIFHKYDS